MHILVLNCGSSSVKADLVDTGRGDRLLSMRIDRVGATQPRLYFSDTPDPLTCPEPGLQAALAYALPLLAQRIAPLGVDAIGHRVVHGGDRFSEPVPIDAAVKAAIQDLSSLAPLHNPINLLGIEACETQWPDQPQVAVFDTAFHHSLPRRARAYALPQDLAQAHGIQRYGFHGTSHQYVARQAAAFLQRPLRQLRLITCHLGSGASICAVEYGRSVETSMGMTPLEGLVMGTRSGDLDPGVMLHLLRAGGLTPDQLDQLLNHDSGLKGLGGDADMRDLEERAATGDEAARLAIQVFSHRVRKYIGAYAAVMGGVDAIVFTGGIGENSASIRERAAQRLEFLGAMLDEDANRDADRDAPGRIADIAMPHSPARILVVPTDEQHEIALQAASLLQSLAHPATSQRPIPIAISARHVHLTQAAVETLFGPGHQLTVYKPLSQPGQFAAHEQVTLVGPKNRIERVRVLGPVRSACQVEISRTDEFFLGIDAPVRASGHTANSPGMTLIGPAGQLTLTEGVICAWRHIHMTPDDATHFGVADKDVVEVRVDNPERSLTFGRVLVRVSPDYRLEMHIDTDEGNAAELGRGATGALVETGASVHLVRRHQQVEPD